MNLFDLLLRWVLCAAALMLVAQVFRGIFVKSFGSALLAALVIGLINALLKPILVILTIPFTILTLGLFLILLNAFLFWLGGRFLRGFDVRGAWTAIGGSIAYSLLIMLIDRFV